MLERRSGTDIALTPSRNFFGWGQPACIFLWALWGIRKHKATSVAPPHVTRRHRLRNATRHRPRLSPSARHPLRLLLLRVDRRFVGDSELRGAQRVVTDADHRTGRATGGAVRAGAYGQAPDAHVHLPPVLQRDGNSGDGPAPGVHAALCAPVQRDVPAGADGVLRVQRPVVLLVDLRAAAPGAAQVVAGQNHPGQVGAAAERVAAVGGGGGGWRNSQSNGCEHGEWYDIDYCVLLPSAGCCIYHSFINDLNLIH